MSDLQKVILPPLLVSIFVSSLLLFNYALAGGVTATTHYTPILISNDTGSDATNVVAPMLLYSQSLVDGNFMESDALNTEVHQGIGGTTDIPFMPASLEIVAKHAFNNAAANETTAAQNTTADDMTLPAANGEVYEFAFDHQARNLRLNIGTKAVATWTITWEYYNGTDYSALSNVTDGTTGLTLDGLRVVEWDIPSDWPRSTLHSLNGFWVRARVSAFTSLTTAPLGTQAHFETGRIWTYTSSVDEDEQLEYVFYTGGTDLRTSHYYFPGTAGITTPDSSTTEVGSSYGIALTGEFSIGVTGSTASATSVYAHKSEALKLFKPTTRNITYTVTATNGTATTLGITGAATSVGIQTIIVADNGTSTLLFLTGNGMNAQPSKTVIDNDSDWVFVDNGTAYYMDSIRVDQAIPSIFNLSNTASTFATGTLTNVEAYTSGLGLGNP